MNSMKRILIAIATILCCVLMASCTKEQSTVTYSMGFDQVHIYNESKMATELSQVENTFLSAIQTELGVNVSNSMFNFNGGDAKVKGACDKAAQSLSQIPLTNKFTYIVLKESTLVYSWAN